MCNGANVTQYEEKVGYPISRIETIWNESIDLERVKYIKEYDEAFVDKYSLRHGDILLSHINSDLHLGKTGIFRSQTKVLIHGINILLIRPSNYISAEFLNYQFKYLRSRGLFIQVAQRAVNQSSINQQKLKHFKIHLPPLSEQHRIVAKIEALFSELDKGIESFKTAREQLKIYRQALLKHAFSGKLTEQWRAGNADKLESAETLLQRIQSERHHRYQQQLKDWEATGKPGSRPKSPKTLPPLMGEELAELPQLPTGWVWSRLEELSENVTDGDHQAPPQTKTGIPFITISDINNQKIDFSETRHVSVEYYKNLSKSRKPEVGDILYTVTGSFGIPCLINFEREFCFQRHIGLIRPCKLIYTKYLYYCLASQHIYNQAVNVATGTAQKTVPLGGLRLFKIPLASTKEQEKIVFHLEECLSETDQLDQTITTALQQAEALRQSILKKAFSGQLVPQDPSDEPASVLLERIRLEKAALSVKPKSIKPKRCSL
jgi:type I restriction enzyme S subunit